jgi:hypothetical protein
MTFRNPWIDPRVLQVKSSDAEAYLRKRGWVRAKCANPNMNAFANSTNVVCVAQLDHADDFSQRMIELISALAQIEDRYAVDVLSDILQPANALTPVNGAAAPQATETAAS